MQKTQPKTQFPSQAVTDVEKSSIEYGLNIGKAIESEWFKKDSGTTRYYNNQNNFHKLKLYARGEQPIQKYKDELSINGDLSYLNLDWKPVPIISKFVDIVVNGINDRSYVLNSYSQDALSLSKRTEYVQSLLDDMRNKEFIQTVQDKLGVNLFNNDPENLPENNDELALHMQLDYKQSVEIAQEEALNNLFEINDYELIKKRLDYDLTVLGIAAVKNSFNTAEGITIDYVDPSDLVYSYTESPYFDDLYYVGEVRRVIIPELKKQYPHLTNEDIKDLESNYSTSGIHKSRNAADQDKAEVNVLYFEYKTYSNQVYKIKKTASGALKSI